jgi:hypothetical protein
MKYVLETCCIVHFVVYKSHSYENKKNRLYSTIHRFSPPCRLASPLLSTSAVAAAAAIASAYYIGCGRRRLCLLYRVWPPSPLLTISVVAVVASAYYIDCGRRRLCSLYRLWPPRPLSPLLIISAVAAAAAVAWLPRPPSPLLIISVVAAAAAVAYAHYIGCGCRGRHRLCSLTAIVAATAAAPSSPLAGEQFCHKKERERQIFFLRSSTFSESVSGFFCKKCQVYEK